jgi:hypothetical protein
MPAVCCVLPRCAAKLATSMAHAACCQWLLANRRHCTLQVSHERITRWAAAAGLYNLRRRSAAAVAGACCASRTCCWMLGQRMLGGNTWNQLQDGGKDVGAAVF